MAYSLWRGAVFKKVKKPQRRISWRLAPLPALGVVSGRVEGHQALHSPTLPPSWMEGGFGSCCRPTMGPASRPPSGRIRTSTTVWTPAGAASPTCGLGCWFPWTTVLPPCTCGRAHDLVPDHQGTALPWPRRQVREPQAQHCSGRRRRPATGWMAGPRGADGAGRRASYGGGR